MKTETKLKLEAIYNEYCMNDLNSLGNEDVEFTDMMKQFVKFRLKVSGGAETTMGAGVGCESISSFLDEICLYDNMMCDWGGAYRGSFCWENLEGLSELLNESDLDKVIKDEIIEMYKFRCNMNED
jgi:hypothetical protein